MITLGKVPYCKGITVVWSIRLLMSDGTDSARRILGSASEIKSFAHIHCTYNLKYNIDYSKKMTKDTGCCLRVRIDIRHNGASLVHLLWHFNLGILKYWWWEVLPVACRRVSRPDWHPLTCNACTWRQTSCSCSTLRMSGTARTLWKTYRRGGGRASCLHSFKV